jgi:hypothetical protein
LIIFLPITAANRPSRNAVFHSKTQRFYDVTESQTPIGHIVPAMQLLAAKGAVASKSHDVPEFVGLHVRAITARRAAC